MGALKYVEELQKREAVRRSSISPPSPLLGSMLKQCHSIQKPLAEAVTIPSLSRAVFCSLGGGDDDSPSVIHSLNIC